MAAVQESGTPSKLRAVLELGRVSNLPTVWTNCLVAIVLAGGSGFAGELGARLWWVLLGGTLLYLAGMTLNDAFDADYDREHKTDRPIAQGAVSVGFVWVLGVAYLISGTFAFVQAETYWPWIAALVGAILLYDWLHKKWIGSVIFMGACRGALLGAAAALFRSEGRESFWSYSLPFCILGLFFYIVGITLVARDEAIGGEPRRWLAGFLYLPCISIPVVLLVGSEATGEVSDFFSGRWMGASLLWLCFVAWVTWTLRGLWGSRPDRVPVAVCRLLAGICLIDASMAAAASLPVGGICVACFVLTLALQRKISGT